tara:strand:- start:47 stop:568 length:522 start_codon:yes stop_codon:yes gene_type:complete
MSNRQQLAAFEQGGSLLFPPVLCVRDNLSIPDGWVDKVEKWCLKSGKYNDKLKLTTTFGTSNQAHLVPWIMEVLNLISPKETFMSSWVQVYKPGGFHPIHNHSRGGATQSGCLFLSEGSSSYFQNPLYKSCIKNSEVKVGDVILWEPELYHFSPPVLEKRIILAFNLFTGRVF